MSKESQSNPEGKFLNFQALTQRPFNFQQKTGRLNLGEILPKELVNQGFQNPSSLEGEKFSKTFKPRKPIPTFGKLGFSRKTIQEIFQDFIQVHLGFSKTFWGMFLTRVNFRQDKTQISTEISGGETELNAGYGFMDNSDTNVKCLLGLWWTTR